MKERLTVIATNDMDHADVTIYLGAKEYKIKITASTKLDSMYPIRLVLLNEEAVFTKIALDAVYIDIT